MSRPASVSFATAVVSASAGVLWGALAAAPDASLLPVDIDMNLLGSLLAGLFVLSLASGLAALWLDASDNAGTDRAAAPRTPPEPARPFRPFPGSISGPDVALTSGGRMFGR